MISDVKRVWFDGYYKDEDIKLEHTRETWKLFEYGLRAIGLLDDEKVYLGLSLDEETGEWIAVVENVEDNQFEYLNTGIWGSIG